MIYLFIGIGTFFVTGVDDLLVVFLLVSTGENVKHKIKAIILGTVVGTAIMFAVAFGLVMAAKPIGDFYQVKILRFFGFFPILLGLRITVSMLINLKQDNKQEEKTIPSISTGLKYFFFAMIIYLGNASDDTAVNASLIVDIISKNNWNNVILLFLGNVIGALCESLIGAYLGNKIRGKLKHFLTILSPLTLITIGTVILLR